jgi:hypothetical protein
MARFFQKVNMASESVASYNRTGLYQESGANAVAYPGYFVKVTGLADNTIYAASGIKDLNKLIVTTPATPTTDKGIFVLDPVKVSEGTINGNVYREGVKTIGLSVNAGEPTAMRELVALHEQFLLGADNFQSAPTVGQYAVLTANDPDLTPASSIPATGFTVAIDGATNVTQGLTAISVYLCRIVQF